MIEEPGFKKTQADAILSMGLGDVDSLALSIYFDNIATADPARMLEIWAVAEARGNDIRWRREAEALLPVLKLASTIATL